MNEMIETQAKVLLLRVVEREPGLVCDLSRDPDPEHYPVGGGSPDWCS